MQMGEWKFPSNYKYVTYIPWYNYLHTCIPAIPDNSKYILHQPSGYHSINLIVDVPTNFSDSRTSYYKSSIERLDFCWLLKVVAVFTGRSSRHQRAQTAFRPDYSVMSIIIILCTSFYVAIASISGRQYYNDIVIFKSNTIFVTFNTIGIVLILVWPPDRGPKPPRYHKIKNCLRLRRRDDNSVSIQIEFPPT